MAAGKPSFFDLVCRKRGLDPDEMGMHPDNLAYMRRPPDADTGRRCLFDWAALGQTDFIFLSLDDPVVAVRPVALFSITSNLAPSQAAKSR